MRRLHIFFILAALLLFPAVTGAQLPTCTLTAPTTTLAGNCTLSTTSVIVSNTTVNGNGFTIEWVGNSARMFRVLNGVNLRLNNVTLDGKNIAAGIEIPGTGSLTITDSTLQNFNEQDGDPGGAIDTNGVVNIKDTIFENNQATDSGVIHVQAGSTLIVETSLFSNNQAVQDGGVLSVYGDAFMVNSTFVNNTATDGGAIYSEGTTTLFNVTLSGNGASGDGGALYIDGGSASLQNSLLANSTSGVDCYKDAGIVVFSNGDSNLIETQTNCGTAETNFITDDPKLGSLTGSPGYLPLDLGSPAIDQGFDNACSTTSQNGFPRPQDGDGDGSAVCDLGAYEVPSANGTDTVGAFYPSNGIWYLRDDNSGGLPTVPTFTYGRGGVPVAGDWNNDGIDTIGAFYPSTGVWYLRDENSRGNPSVTPFTYGKGGVPVAGDWNNDGTDSIGVFYPSTGTWYLRDENAPGNPSVTPFTYGRGGVPVVGDWNGDGTDTVGVFYPSTGTWYLRDENAPGGPSVTPFTYGKGGVPVAGDWDSDGDDSIGVFYPSTGIWYLRDENAPGNPSVTPFTYGRGGVPVVGDWDGAGASAAFVQGIGAISLVDADSGQRITVIEDGQRITNLPENVQIVAEAFGGNTVIFDYQGVDDFATDSDAPFTLTGENPTALASGNHTLTATLYNEGVLVDTLTITFSVE